MVKKDSKMLEEEKTALRNMSRESKEYLYKLETDKKITEDDKFADEKKVQEITDSFIKKIEEMGDQKALELRTV